MGGATWLCLQSSLSATLDCTPAALLAGSNVASSATMTSSSETAAK